MEMELHIMKPFCMPTQTEANSPVPSDKSQIMLPAIDNQGTPDGATIAADGSTALLVLQLQHELEQVKRSRAGLAARLDAMLQHQQKTNNQAKHSHAGFLQTLVSHNTQRLSTPTEVQAQRCRAPRQLQTAPIYSKGQEAAGATKPSHSPAQSMISGGKQKTGNQLQPVKPAAAARAKRASHCPGDAKHATSLQATAKQQTGSVHQSGGQGHKIRKAHDHPQKTQGKKIGQQRKAQSGNSIQPKVLVRCSIDHVSARQIFPPPRSLTAKAIVEANLGILRTVAGADSSYAVQAQHSTSAIPKDAERPSECIPDASCSDRASTQDTASPVAALDGSQSHTGRLSGAVTIPVASTHNAQDSNLCTPALQSRHDHCSSAAESASSVMSWLRQHHGSLSGQHGMSQKAHGRAQHATSNPAPTSGGPSHHASAGQRAPTIPQASLKGVPQASDIPTSASRLALTQHSEDFLTSAEKAQQAFTSNAARLACAADAAEANSMTTAPSPQVKNKAYSNALHRRRMQPGAAVASGDARLALAHDAAAVDAAARLARQAEVQLHVRGRHQAAAEGSVQRRPEAGPRLSSSSETAPAQCLCYSSSDCLVQPPPTGMEPQDSAALTIMEAGLAVQRGKAADSAQASRLQGGASPGVAPNLLGLCGNGACKSSLQVSEPACSQSQAQMQAQLSETLDEMELGNCRPSYQEGKFLPRRLVVSSRLAIIRHAATACLAYSGPLAFAPSSHIPSLKGCSSMVHALHKELQPHGRNVEFASVAP